MSVLLLIILWLVSFTFSFGVATFIFITMRHAAERPWQIKMSDYKPRISILVPTYNEAEIVRLKLENLARVKYPKNLMQIIVVDSNSEDQTVNIVSDFIKHHSLSNFQVLVQSERMGKSPALNFALKHCNGDVVIVSDVDCFWPSDILEKALPFLADPSVGAVSGPKILLNPNHTWVTKTEDVYLNSMNIMKLGESKIGSTLLFEGGFSAYKREAFTSFDPYNTGSDDCGTVIKLIENGYRALLVPEARFYSAFPINWKGKLKIKIRRANQLVKVFWKYAFLLFDGRIKSSKRTVVQGILLYIIGPLMFALFIITTVGLLMNFPYLILLLSILLVPKIGVYALEVFQNYFLLLIAMLMVAINKKFVIWSQPEDRMFFKEEVLRAYKLI
ncbi:MAG: glycosyltransferase [Candidatus Aenigmatarchaeota archaeon]